MVWTSPKGGPPQYSNAYLAYLLKSNAHYTQEQTESLRRFSATLSELVPTLDDDDSLATALSDMVEIAARGEAERSSTRVEDTYM
jgi:hypothetical protein